MNAQEFDKLIASETSLIAYLDLSNMFHWQDTLKWQFSIYEVIKQLLAIKNLKEVRIYYGLNERELEKSTRFHQRVREAGAFLVTKPVKWIRKEITRDLFVSPFTLNRLDKNAHSKLDQFVAYLHEQNISIEEPKCNFDVEMALDMLDAMDKVSGALLLSGDSDLCEPLQRLRLKGRSVYVFGVRGKVAKELWAVCSKYVDFGQWYVGPKKRKPLAKGERPRD
jgi:uncharacterized LabA/DUF88 family protein